MRARKFVLIAVVAVVAILAARALGLWVGGQFLSPPTTQPAPLPALVFAEEDLTFGPIPESEPVERTLRLTNHSAEPITVERFDTSCSCLGVEPAGNLTLPAGETATLTVRLRASIATGATLSADDLFTQTVSLSAVRPGGEVRAELRYTVRQTIRIDPPLVQLGVVSHREPLTAKATLTLRQPITDVRVLPHPEWMVSVKTTGDGTRELLATPTKPGVPRTITDTLQLVPVGSDGQDRPARPLTLRGQIKGDVIGSPEVIPLGRVRVGAVFEESFRLMSITNRKFEVAEVVSDSADVTVAKESADPKAFVVRVKTSGAGEQTRTVSVTVNQDDGTTWTARVLIQFHTHQGEK